MPWSERLKTLQVRDTRGRLGSPGGAWPEDEEGVVVAGGALCVCGNGVRVLNDSMLSFSILQCCKLVFLSDSHLCP
jgi:hypothetical protein